MTSDDQKPAGPLMASDIYGTAPVYMPAVQPNTVMSVAVWRDREGDYWLEIDGRWYMADAVDADGHPWHPESARKFFGPLERVTPRV